MCGATSDVRFGPQADIPLRHRGSRRLALLSHGAVDAGVGYTYFDQKTGHEFSAVTGLTYNFINPSTNYQNGVDWHLDWAASQFLSQQFSLGVVGYIYKEIGCDSGSGDRVGCFQSQVFGVGPQVTYLFPVGNMQGYLNLKAYKEFDAQNRPGSRSRFLRLRLPQSVPLLRACRCNLSSTTSRSPHSLALLQRWAQRTLPDSAPLYGLSTCSIRWHSVWAPA